jgi:outer membrane protein assembly factor BamB
MSRLCHGSAVIALFCIFSSLASGQDVLQFRGTEGQGHFAAKRLPLTWSETRNVAWKTKIDGLGWSSPTVAGDQIWLTTALDDGKSLRAVCLDKKSGRLVHDVEVLRLEDPGEIHTKNSHASPTPIIHGDRVFVHYGAHGTGCVSREGKVLWTTRELVYEHRHGPGGSPVVFGNLLLVSCDGTDVQFVVALDQRDGKIVWKTPRNHISEARIRGEKNAAMAYSTPLLVEIKGRTQLISTGADHVAAYDPKTGEELWWSEYDGYSLIPRPVVGHGMVYVCSGYDSPALYAIRLGGSGNVTRSHAAWKLQRGAPHSASPLLVGDELYIVSDAGVAMCLDAKTGRQHWQQRLGGNFSASPIYADGRIYFLDERGKSTVLKPGKTFQRLATNQVAGRTLASLVAIDGAILLRTDEGLYRMSGERKAESGEPEE